MAMTALRRVLPFVFGVAVATAQQFDELRLRALPSPRSTTMCVLLADLDGDGDRDLVCGGSNRLYRNQGHAIFADDTLASLPTGLGTANAIACGDFDGDSDLDLVLGVGSFAGWQDRLLRNDGSGHFTDVTATQLPVDADWTSAVATADIDGDGDLDLVFGNFTTFPGPCRIQVNNGSATFTDVTTARLGNAPVFASDVALVDVDGDGDPDLLLNDPVRLFRNNGGVFTDVSATHVPPNVSAERLVLIDFDGDGFRDLYCPDRQGSHLLRNDGSGVFTDETAARLPSGWTSWWAALAIDVDGDGAADLVEGAGVLRNNGAGVFLPSTAIALPTDEFVLSIAGGDLDGDGDADLVFGAREFVDGHDHLLLGDGSGGFVDVSPARLAYRSAYASDLVSGDFDGDGDIDLFSTGQQACGLWRNDGSGWFTDVSKLFLPHLPSWTSASKAAALDADGDGDLDLVVVGPGQSVLLRNNGGGTFTLAPAGSLPQWYVPPEVIASGDLDGDGDIDLVYGLSMSGAIVLDNRAGRFVPTSQIPFSFGLRPTVALAIGDIDGDGDLDIAGGVDGAQNRLYRNTGNGLFVDATSNLPPDVDATRGLALVDVDGDGDLDLVCANTYSQGTMSAQDRLYRNDGTGVFTDVTAACMPPDTAGATAIATGDVDGDGDMDLLLLSSDAPWHSLYRNDGSGHFTDVTAAEWPQELFGSVLVLADLDRDGDLDVVVGPSEKRVCMNVARQLHEPWPARVGRPFRMEVWQHGATGPGVALVALSSTRIPGVSTPFGVLGIAPMSTLPPLLIASPNGVGSAQFSLPTTPALVGFAFHAQALLASSAGVHLTNVTTNLILP